MQEKKFSEFTAEKQKLKKKKKNHTRNSVKVIKSERAFASTDDSYIMISFFG